VTWLQLFGYPLGNEMDELLDRVGWISNPPIKMWDED
jgi:hypothetical protein